MFERSHRLRQRQPSPQCSEGATWLQASQGGQPISVSTQCRVIATNGVELADRPFSITLHQQQLPELEAGHRKSRRQFHRTPELTLSALKQAELRILRSQQVMTQGMYRIAINQYFQQHNRILVTKSINCVK
ncbi:hypothetical protein ABB30_04845 [Stenotrophomonas ginsengisoli]|uniref:Uncharacterized protein n=1 Tax=Stenotrophomonas ginsengisoli TaxID=336566 RepID=A0A0R0DK66_9GAMM|nr:hypothetical protein [Stenotrophomonas ginsengisoli]KRG78372.1 hypothetical protein ABB30_04845 [Stenotrophomonas ginsengisoli]